MFGIDDAILGGGLSLLGGAAGLLGGGGGGGTSRQSTNSSTNWNQTNTTSPWAGFQPYLLGMPFNEDGTQQSGPAGLFPEAARLYGQSAWSQPMQDTAQGLFGDTFNANAIFKGNGGQNVPGALLAGQFDPNITAAGPIAGPGNVGLLSPVDARAAQGELDPTKALQGYLQGGEAANPWIGQQQKAITDLTTRNFKEQILPGIRQTAIADGQYGGSRGDIANTMAVSRLNTDLAPALTGLASGAYENAQNRGLTTGLALNQQAGDFAKTKLGADTVNAGNLLDVQKFNTGTTLNNNSQVMQAAAQDVANRGAAFGFAQQGQGLTEQYYADMLKSLNLPTDVGFDRLAQYGALIQPGLNFTTQNGAGTSNTTGTTTGYSPGGGGGGVGGLLGGAVTGLGIASGLGLFGNRRGAGSGTVY